MMVKRKKEPKKDGSKEGRHEKKTDKIKVMIKRPGKDSFEPFLFRLSTTGFFQGRLVQIYGRPYPDASDRTIKVEKLVFRSDRDLDKVVGLMTDCLIGARRMCLFSTPRKKEEPDLSDVGEKTSRFLSLLISHPAIEVNPTLFPGRRHLGTSPA